jgi:hypothetical protein
MNNNTRIILIFLALFSIVLIIGKKYSDNNRTYESFFVEEGPSVSAPPTTAPPTTEKPLRPSAPTTTDKPPTLTVDKNTNPNSNVHLTDEETKKMKFVIEKIFSGIGKMASNSLTDGIAPASLKNETFQTMCSSKPANFY